MMESLTVGMDKTATLLWYEDPSITLHRTLMNATCGRPVVGATRLSDHPRFFSRC